MAVRRLFVALCVCSGVAGVVYHAMFTRLLTLALGQTAGATAAALAAFLGGLALGATLSGRRASRLSPRGALAQSAFLDIFVALAALGIGPLLVAAQPLLTSLYQASQDSSPSTGALPFAAVRVLVCVVCIIPPAAAMGATWPLRLRWFASIDATERETLCAGQLAGTMYASLAVGGAIGAALVGFVLLPAFGLAIATLVAVALSVVIAAGMLLLQQWTRPPAAPSATPISVLALTRVVAAPAPERIAIEIDLTRTKARPTSAAAALAMSGFIALTYYLVWARLLALTLGPTTTVRSLTVTIFLLGLAIGAALATRIVPRVPRPIIALAATQMLAAFAAFLLARLVPSMPALSSTLLKPSDGPLMVLLVESAIATLMLLPIAIALGATFPFAVATAVRNGAPMAAQVIARVSSANMLGAIAGALATAFILIPQFGLERSILLAGLIGTLSGVELTWRSRKRDHLRIWMTTFGVLTAVLGLSLTAWNPKMLSGGAYRYRGLSPSELQVELDAGTLLLHEDGAEGTVAVRHVAGEHTLSLDGALRATNTSGRLTEKLLAHLPLLLHPSPNEVCILGLGTGITTGAALTHPVDRVDTIERSPEIVEATQVFATENHHALNDPRVRLLSDDGRAHLRLSRHAYDVIISAPPPPWMAGAAPLFTRELFDAARDRLKPGGLFCQWAPASHIQQDDLKSIVATFASVFPGASAWLVGDRDLLLIGGRGPVAPLLANVDGAWRRPGVADDLAQVDVRDPFSLLSLLVADGPALETLAANKALAQQTDDRAALEFSAPIRFDDRPDLNPGANAIAWLTDADSMKASRPAIVVGAETSAGAAEWRNRAVMLLRADAPDRAYDSAARSLTLDPSDAEALSTLSHAAAALQRQADAVSLLEGLVARAPNSLAPLVELSRLRAAGGQIDPAIEAATQATRQFPEMFAGWEQLASLFVRTGDVPRLSDVIDHMGANFGDRWETAYYTGMLYMLRGEFGSAARMGEQVLTLRPTEARALNLSGAAYAALGVRDRAREAYEASLSSQPRDPATYVTLGRFELDNVNPQRAAALFTEALFLDPRSPAALNGLADALARMGRSERAAELRARAGSF